MVLFAGLPLALELFSKLMILPRVLETKLVMVFRIC
jgi:hypothetical protein